MEKMKNKKGITIIALAITMVVITILAVSVVASIKSTTNLKQYYSVKEDILTISEAVKQYYADNNGDLSGIVTGKLSQLDTESFISTLEKCRR